MTNIEHNQRRQELPFSTDPIKPEDITQLFNLRSRLAVSNISEIGNICSEIQIPSPMIESESLDKIRKDVFKTYFNKKFSKSESIEEHANNLDQKLNQLVEHLAMNGSESILFTFGSYANGKINGTHSDIDLISILPQKNNIKDIDREINIIKGLKDKGFIFSEELGPFDNLKPIIKNGKGLSRLYSMTTNAIEVEFHLFGLQDGFNIHKKNEHIKRISPISPKSEIRTSFTGEKKPTPKPGDKVLNFFTDQNIHFKGFFPEALIGGKLIYDPNHVGEKIVNKLWDYYIVRFIYYNQSYCIKDGSILIDQSQISFPKFLNTFYYGNRNNYSPERLAEFERSYLNALGRLKTKRKSVTLFDSSY